MDSFSLVSFLDPLRVSGPPEARNPNLMVLAALTPEKEPRAEIVSILNDIFPPREFEEGGFRWRQVVSTKQVSRSDKITTAFCTFGILELDYSSRSLGSLIMSLKVRRDQVSDLGGRLTTKLVESQARLTGICQKRRELFSQAFDELIRQVGQHYDHIVKKMSLF